MNQQMGSRSKRTYTCDVCGFAVYENAKDDIKEMQDHLRTHPVGSTATSAVNRDVALMRPEAR